MIAIINYGLGNIKAFETVYKKLRISCIIATKSEDLKQATKLILPGVGSFDHAMQMLDKSGLRTILDELVINKQIPVLGICVGMQMLANGSEEGKLPGLGWIDGHVNKFIFSKENQNLPLPHMGWNTIIPIGTNKLFSGIEKASRFYFLHSYYFKVGKKENTIAATRYGFEFSSAVSSNNIYGVQFHPEKSHQNGIQVLKNFGNL